MSYHRQRNLYYGNHDLVMAFSKDNSRRFVNSFVALNTPEKLDPIDRQKVIQENHNLNQYNGLKSLLLGSLMSVAFFRHNHHRLLAVPFMTFGYLTYFNSKSDMKFMTGQLMSEIAQKYDFSVFDFHESKRSSIYKTIVQTLKVESNSLISKNIS
jgi:hypothetical protein